MKILKRFLIVAVIVVIGYLTVLLIVKLATDNIPSEIVKSRSCEQRVMEAVAILSPTIYEASLDSKWSYEELMEMEYNRLMKVHCENRN